MKKIELFGIIGLGISALGIGLVYANSKSSPNASLKNAKPITITNTSNTLHKNNTTPIEPQSITGSGTTPQSIIIPSTKQLNPFSNGIFGLGGLSDTNKYINHTKHTIVTSVTSHRKIISKKIPAIAPFLTGAFGITGMEQMNNQFSNIIKKKHINPGKTLYQFAQGGFPDITYPKQTNELTKSVNNSITGLNVFGLNIKKVNNITKKKVVTKKPYEPFGGLFRNAQKSFFKYENTPFTKPKATIKVITKKKKPYEPFGGLFKNW